ncbi:RelA/SpoT family protein [Psychrobacter sp. FDAARGOS_221]|uniref:RelA/SpoT family protein n=1 Tax=Psychrobacter sp. FDAARGOS_221 TaxID=1975705 RepID=UPI000BB5724C|nr:HD domain-containing protein [Psychrobacter sp. FDAARGOS_221]PNK60191.1 bifunctional (p)ppGpp synthetase/guanosine-3',5'-bis(diphosphate) 3'-pyrophosphohydrolase [Psychrobacter sp. FDAARGOS_221]
MQKLPKLSHHLVDESQRNLMRAVAYLTDTEKQDILDACAFGDKAHIKDKRKSGEPYITHPIAVAEILAGFRLDRDSIIAAILHDTVEDTEVTSEQISERYGITVARLVDGVTKLKSSNHNKQQNKAATFHKIMSATLDDPRVLIIKLADRLHNMSTLDSVRPEKQRATASETLQFYVPFARLMGLNDIADYMEILCYRNLDPVMYTKMSDKLLQHGLGRKYQKEAIQQYLNYVLDKHAISGHVRVLDNQVIMYRQFFRNRGEMEDLLRHYAFEIVTNTIEDCDSLADYLIKKYRIPNNLIEDNIRHPLPGGNQSLTLTYIRDNDTIKVTLLTRKMQAAARLGVIGAEQASDLSRSVIKASLRNMKELIDTKQDEDKNSDSNVDAVDKNADNYDDMVETIDELISYLNSRKIVCYSPKGRAYELPRGATALDFAYAVGPKVGNIATGAKINGHNAKLGSVLQAGQKVEIEVDKDAKPKAEWLGIVVTSKAQRTLKRWFSSLPEEEQQQHGKQALDRALQTYGKSIKDVTQEDWEDLLQWQNVSSKQDLYQRMSAGALLPQLVVSRLFSDDVTKSHQQAHKTGFNRPNQLLSNANGVEVHFAGCCRPIFGDPIIGHLTMHGLVLHRHRCYSIINKYAEKPYELVQLDWYSEEEIEKHIEHPSDRPHFTAYLKINLALNDEQVSHVLYTLRQLSIGIEKVDIRSDSTIIHVIVRSRSHVLEGIEALRPHVGFGSIRRLYRL